jgi:hypothetical protein
MVYNRTRSSDRYETEPKNLTTEIIEKPIQQKNSPTWVGKWARDEAFWKDVTANTTAGVLLILITAMFAVGSGLWSVPNVRNVILVGLVLVVGLVTTGILMLIATIWIKPKRFNTRKGLEALWTIFHMIVLFGLLAVYMFGVNALGKWILQLP